MKHDITVTICNERGLHARASAKFMQCAEGFDADIAVSRGNQTVDGKSIIDLMMLAAGPGTTIRIVAEGPEADAAVTALRTLVEDGFGETSSGSDLSSTPPAQ